MTTDSLASLALTVADSCRRVASDLEDISEELASANEREHARRVTVVLCALEDAEQTRIHGLARCLGGAVDLLGDVLRVLQSRKSSAVERPIHRLAGAMVTLYPLRRALDAALSEEPSPVVLDRPKKRAVVELVRNEAPPPVQRRQRDRIPLEAHIGLESETNFFAGFSNDVSEGGLFVATYALLPVDSEVSLSFVLPGGHQITANGRVAWLRQPSAFDSEVHPGMGVELIDLDQEGLAAIRAYMLRRAPIFHDR